MADPSGMSVNISPISHVLQSLGLTREDLLRHSDQMRQFLTAEDANSLRVLIQDIDGQQPQSRSSASSSSMARSLSRSNSSTHASPPPPRTPVKAEPTESLMPPRHFDSMEAVIERKSRQSKRERKNRKERGKHRANSPAVNLDTFMHARTRDGRRVESADASSNVAAQDPVPVTPQTRKYYREHTHEDSISRSHSVRTFSNDNQQGPFSPRPGSPTPTRPKSLSAVGDLFTPRKDHYKSPLPSSSPPAASSPFSSPTRRIVNIVSSPGPMGPLPAEDEYDDLPYTLPPGPYSEAKPDLSYAALVGQAILSSPAHRLTLQEIYDWITIVYPHFKRGETTWMNSIRHVLSTTACFRKVTRERSAGRTLWAIWDCDLECFKDGGFKKQYCADMAGKGVAKNKRPATDEAGSAPKKAKKQKRAATAPKSYLQPAVFPGVPTVSHGHHPLFPSVRPSTNLQPYYESCLPQQVRPGLLFQSLSSSNYRPFTSTSTSTSHSQEDLVYPSQDEFEPTTSPPPPSSSASIPSLTPNCSSSSPPLPSEDTPPDASSSHAAAIVTSEPDDPGSAVFGDMGSVDALEPGITLLNHVQQKKLDKGQGKAGQVNVAPITKKSSALPPMPTSPTLDRKSAFRKPAKAPSPPPEMPVRITTPPPRPSTPPRNPNNGHAPINLSPIRTPLSHKGLHMSPSPSLAHYKSHLDPPPVAPFLDGVNPALTVDAGNVRTPSRKRSAIASSVFGPPLTPKKLVFPSAGGTQDSPFRTPGSRSIFDPHDPSALLDDELSRMGAQGVQDSPAGLFGKSRGMLYESPNAESPGRWTKWW